MMTRSTFRIALYLIRPALIVSLSVMLTLLLPIGCADSGSGGAGTVEKVFGKTGLSPGEFSYPRAIAVSPVDGCVFVVDKTARIQRFSADGDYEHQWRMPEYVNGKPTGLFVDSQNRIWVADTHYFRVMLFDRDGKELRRFGSQGEGPGQFVFPCSVTLSRDGTVYVGEYGGNDRISRFTQDGKYLDCIADKSTGDGWVERPAGIAFDENDQLWVADACHHRICLYGKDGKFQRAFGTAGDGQGQFNYPYGLALESGGTLLVADRGNNRISRFQRDGRWLASWGTPGRAEGQIAQPWGVAVSASGGIYCLDSWNNRVQLIDW